MFNHAKALQGYQLQSLNGEIGKVDEFYFDDKHWIVRYLVAGTGNWLTGKQVLISPYALMSVDNDGRHIDVNLTKKQIEESPPLDTDKPVSRQFEDSYYGYYGWPSYWSGLYAWGLYPYLVRDRTKWKKPAQAEDTWDPHLRSTREVSGYKIQATDGEIGHIDDFIIDDGSWAVRYIIVDTQNWWPGKKVLVAPKWIERVSWEDSKIFVNLSRETVKLSPEYTDASRVTRDYEDKLHRHYKRQGYWTEEPSDLTSG